MRNFLKNKKVGYISIIVLIKVSVLVAIYAFTTNDDDCQEHISSVLTKLDSIRTTQIQLPENLKFAGESVPMEYFDVRESLDREMQVNTFYHSQTILLLKKANRYFPIIEPILKENGIPDDFKYMCVIESSLSNAVSPSKAVGFWQILEHTGKELGLEINKEVDERYNIEKSTTAACKFLRKSYEKFGNWTMAAASYNFGRNGIDKQMERQENESYYDLVLGEETGRYLYRILAVKLIIENPAKYGFDLQSEDLYPPLSFYQVVVDSSITNLSAFARYHNTNYKMLKYFNPWLRENYLPNKSGKKYTIQIPTKDYRSKAYDKQ